MTEVAPSNGHAEAATARKANKVDDRCGADAADDDDSLPSPSTSSPRSSSSSSLPVIDIGPLLSSSSFSSPQALAAAEAIAAACLKSRGEGALGFFYAVGHGIPEEALDAAHAAAGALWGSPEEVRAALDARASPLARGYLGLGALEHTCTRAELATLARERLGGEGENEEEELEEKEEEAKKEEEDEKKARTEAEAPKASGDFKQSFAFGCEREDGDPRTLSPMHGPNQWPDARAIELVPPLRGFRRAAEEFRALGLEAARAVARGLSLALTTKKTENGENVGDPSMFESALSKPAALTVMLRYPPLPEEEEERGEKKGGEKGKGGAKGAAASTSCGAHTDCGFLTLIDQRGLPGLEVFSNKGEWISVPPLRTEDGQSALVVNLGDLAEYWSGGRVASTLHRVEVRGGKKKDVEEEKGGPRVRDSLIVFSNANFDAPVVPPTTGEGEKNGGGKPTTAGAYILEKLGIMWNGPEEKS